LTAPSNPPSSEPATPASETLEVGSIGIIIQDGTTARYIVGEQLARQSLPSDAVGETSNVTGAIIFGEDGSVMPSSVIIVGVNSLRSNESRRDGFLRRSSIQTSRFPEARFAVTGIEGLGWPLPSEGSATFTLLGDMTIRDVTRPVILSVDAEFAGDSISAKASTTITFDQFEMSKPRLAFILSVEDEIRLELDIQALVRTGN
jgi:polyisoprenoid-binding protein YceI